VASLFVESSLFPFLHHVDHVQISTAGAFYNFAFRKDQGTLFSTHHNDNMGKFIGFIVEVIVLACCAAAVVTNSLLLRTCQVLKLSVGENDVATVGSLGLYFANFPEGTVIEDTNGQCIRIDNVPNIDNYKDAAFNCARVCAVIAFICGACLLLFGVFKQCLCPLPGTQLVMDVSGGIVQIMLALVYVIWATEACNVFQCTFGNGGTYLVLTQLFWMLAACFTRWMRPGRYERRDEIRAAKEEKKRKEAAKAAKSTPPQEENA
jgi:hypothetical protein